MMSEDHHLQTKTSEWLHIASARSPQFPAKNLRSSPPAPPLQLALILLNRHVSGVTA
jgi:hypothetical protein